MDVAWLLKVELLIFRHLAQAQAHGSHEAACSHGHEAVELQQVSVPRASPGGTNMLTVRSPLTARRFADVRAPSEAWHT